MKVEADEPPAHAYHARFCRAEDLGRVRGVVAEYADAAGLAEEKTTGLLVAVTELISNTIQHTEHGFGCLRVWIDGNTVHCQVNDAGKYTPGLVDRPMPTDIDGRGFGLPLARRLVDRLECAPTSVGAAWKVRSTANSVDADSPIATWEVASGS